MVDLQWADDSTLCTIDGTDFVTLGDGGVGDAAFERLFYIGSLESTDRAFVLLKPRELLEWYAHLFESVRPMRVFELGIFQGGSVAFLAAAARPTMLVAIEYETERVGPLDRYIEGRGLSESVHTYYGVDQADADALRSIVDADFGATPLDLVIDDASHLRNETRSSFNTLFPRLRTGGVYVIEDWAWGSTPTANVQLNDYMRTLPPPLAGLVFEIGLACASTPGLIDDITITTDAAIIRRGPAAVPRDAFDVRDCYWDELDIGLDVRRPPS